MDRDATLREVEQRVLWLATSIVHHANRVRPNPDGLKVGGHQASSASLVSIMTALWFNHLRPEDRVSVKPHASPVLHAINYLLGELSSAVADDAAGVRRAAELPEPGEGPRPRRLLHRLRRHRRHRPDLGCAGAPLRRRALGHRAAASTRSSATPSWTRAPAGRRSSTRWCGPRRGRAGSSTSTGSSLDRIVPNIAAVRLAGMFDAAGWQVLTVKYGRLLHELFDRPGRRRAAAADRRDGQPRVPAPAALHARPAAGTRAGRRHEPPSSAELVAGLDDATLHAAIRNLGGHDLASLREAFDAIDDTRPTVIFAYTVKGYGLATEGHPQNHSSLLTAEQWGELAAAGRRVDRAAVGPLPGVVGRRGAVPRRPPSVCAARPSRRTPCPQLPTDIGRTPGGHATTQAALGRTLLDLTRSRPGRRQARRHRQPRTSARRTNLGGWVNKVGVWSADASAWTGSPTTPRPSCTGARRPDGQHMELGIAETNLVGLLGELGATWSRWGEPLLPIGVLYDPFVERALEPWSFGIYAGGQSILVGTPSGVTLAPEGGAHQSITTPSVGLEQPGCTMYEPAFAIDVEWTLLAALARLGRPGGRSAYLRLSTRPVDQTLAAIPDDPAARERRRRQVVAGGYPLRRADGPPAVTIAAMGAVVPEALAAADRLTAQGVGGRHGVHHRPPACCSTPCRPAPARATRRELDPRRASCPPAGPRRWSPCSTGTRTRWPSSPASTRCGPRTSACRRSASPAASARSTATTASTPTRSSAPPWT